MNKNSPPRSSRTEQGILIQVLRVQVHSSCPDLGQNLASLCLPKGSVLLVRLGSRLVSHPDTLKLPENLFHRFDINHDYYNLISSPAANSLSHLIEQINFWRSHYSFVLLDTLPLWNQTVYRLFMEAHLNLIAVDPSSAETAQSRTFLNQMRNQLLGGERFKFSLLKPSLTAARPWHDNLEHALSELTQQISFRAIPQEAPAQVKEVPLQADLSSQIKNKDFLAPLSTQVVSEILPPSPPLKPKDSAKNPSIQVDYSIDPIIPHQATPSKKIPAPKKIHFHPQYFHFLFGKIQNFIASRICFLYLSLPKTFKGYYRLSVWAFVCLMVFLGSLLIPQTRQLKLDIPNSNLPLLTPYTEDEFSPGSVKPMTFRLSQSENLYRIAKYAICKHRAVVPTQKQIKDYVNEVIAYHNSYATKKISPDRYISEGTEVYFFPPTNIRNNAYSQVAFAFDYFTSVVDDPFAYITGTWAERGTGGNPQHEGIDVAAPQGTLIRTPIAGKVVYADSRYGGRSLGVIQGKDVLLFAHLDKKLVKEGVLVNKGDAVGTVGMTGRTTGPHVHVSYGIEYPSGIKLGTRSYKLTDPLLWFYKQAFSHQKSLF